VADKLKMVEADDGHGYTLPRRLAGYAWMSKWLKGQEDDGVEPQFPLATETELECTKTGQVATSLGGESIASAGGTPITSTSYKHHDRREVKKLGADANAIAWWQVFTELLIWEAQPGSAARITGAREGRRRNARVPRGHLVEIEHVLQRGRVLVTRGQVRPRTSIAGKAEEALLDEGEQ